MSKWLRELALENLPVKALALLFSLLFFTYVHGQEDIREKTLAVPLVSLPPLEGERELMTVLPPNVHVTLRGPARALSRIVQEGLSPIEVDLRRHATDKIQFSASTFSLPREVAVVAVDPGELNLAWEQIITRVVPLRATTTGEPSSGNEVGTPLRFEPSQVTVRGPVSKVEVLQYASIAPFDVGSLAPGKYTRRLSLSPLVPPNRYLGSETATVTVEVRRRERERIFRGLAVQIVGPALATPLPRLVDITLTGAPELVDTINTSQVVPQVDLVALGKWSGQPGHGSAVVPVAVPLDGVVTRVQPPSIIVKW
jgi:hypothetical protein